jgi:hypothetical protein
MSRPEKGSLDWYGIYMPNVIKMAESKVRLCKGKKRKKLLAKIEECKRLDGVEFGIKADLDDPAWLVAANAACEAAWSLSEFAGPI